jgi:hypothetical protein
MPAAHKQGRQKTQRQKTQPLLVALQRQERQKGRTFSLRLLPFAFWALLCCRLLAAGWAMYSPACRLPPATAHCSQKQRLRSQKQRCKGKSRPTHNARDPCLGAAGTRATDAKAKVAQRITQGTLASLAFELRAKGALRAQGQKGRTFSLPSAAAARRRPCLLLAVAKSKGRANAQKSPNRVGRSGPSPH